MPREPRESFPWGLIILFLAALLFGIHLFANGKRTIIVEIWDCDKYRNDAGHCVTIDKYK